MNLIMKKWLAEYYKGLGAAVLILGACALAMDMADFHWGGVLLAWGFGGALLAAALPQAVLAWSGIARAIRRRAEKLAAARREAERLRGMYESLRREAGRLGRDNAEMSVNAAMRELALAERREEIAALRHANRERALKLAKADALRRENMELRGEAEALRRDSWQDQQRVDELRGEIESYQFLVADLNEDIRELRAGNADTRDAYSRLRDDNVRLADANRELRRENEKLRAYKGYAEKLRGENRDMKNQIADMRKNAREIIDNMLCVDDLRASRENEIRALRGKTKRLVNDVINLRAEISHAGTRDRLRMANARLLRANGNLRGEIEQLRQENRRLAGCGRTLPALVEAV